MTSASGVGDGSATAEAGVVEGGFVVVEFDCGGTNSAGVEVAPLRSFGWGDAAAFTNMGADAACVFSFCRLFWGDASAFVRFGGGPTISAAFGTTEAIALTTLGAGLAAVFATSDETAVFSSFGECSGFVNAAGDEGEILREDAFAEIALVGLGFPAGAFKPLFGAEPV